MSGEVPEASFTTNVHDQAQASKLQERLASSSNALTNTTFQKVDSVSIDDGAHKYVLIAAREPGSIVSNHFVVSTRGAAYHRNVAEPFVERLESCGYQDIRIEGGGRIYLDQDAKKIRVFGFSYGFGQADHEISKQKIQQDERFHDHDITVSNDGY